MGTNDQRLTDILLYHNERNPVVILTVDQLIYAQTTRYNSVILEN